MARFLIRFFILIAIAMPPLRAAPTSLFSVQGSNTIGARLLPSCAQAFLEQQLAASDVMIENGPRENEYRVGNQQRQIEIAAHGSSTGFVALGDGSADLAMASRPIKAKELDALSGLGDLSSVEGEHVIAIDGLAILVNPQNPIDQLTIDQIGKIFSGEYQNWAQLGGNDQAIQVHARDERSGTWDTFSGLVLGKKYQLVSTARRYESNDRLSDQVASEPGAIGFAGLASVRNAKLLAVADEGTAALKPNKLTVATEDYPLSRRLFLYRPPRSENSQTRALIDFCQSHRGQNIVEQIGFVSQNIIAVEQADYANAPAAYRQLSQQARRLSVNFRFKEGSARLDNKALRDIDRLADYMSSAQQESAKLVLVGFNDAHGRNQIETLLSRFRALAVQSALIRRQIPVSEVIGLGAFMPVAASGQEAGAVKNGRVEVWVYAGQSPQRNALSAL